MKRLIKMAERWRNDAAVLKRMERVASLHLVGLNAATIAKRLNVSPSTIGRDVDRLRVCWWERFGKSFNATNT